MAPSIICGIQMAHYFSNLMTKENLLTDIVSATREQDFEFGMFGKYPHQT